MASLRKCVACKMFLSSIISTDSLTNTNRLGTLPGNLAEAYTLS